jgi:hypothetical protein
MVMILVRRDESAAYVSGFSTRQDSRADRYLERQLAARDRDFRKGSKPSDHAPLLASLT